MRIGIDVRPYLHDPSGMGQYAFYVIKYLLAHDIKHTYILFADEDFDVSGWQGNYRKVVYNKFSGKLKKIYFQLATIFTVKRLCDLFFSTSSLNIAAIYDQFSIVVIHDIVTFKFPQLHTPWVKALITIPFTRALRHARSIITVSQNTKDDILNMFPFVPKEKIHVIPLGLDNHLQEILNTYSPSRWDTIRTSYHIQDRYLFFVGSIEPRKNLLRILEAFTLYCKKIPHTQLIISGKKGWGYTEFLKYLQTLPQQVQDQIIVTGVITEEEKAYLFKHAEMLVWPSLYEGFGMPLLEAMQIGIPIITSNTSSLPEVVGDAALLITPTNVSELYENMIKLHEDTSLRQELIQKGFSRVAVFDWNMSAKEILKLFDDEARDD